MEQQTETTPVDERRQKMLDSLAKARAVRAAKLAQEPRQEGIKAPAKRKPRKKTAKTRLDEAIVQHKIAKKGPPSDWLDGIHHMPNGCPIACKGGICIITMENICAHPDTNLQAHYLRGDRPEVVERFAAAKLELRRLDAEKSLKKV